MQNTNEDPAAQSSGQPAEENKMHVSRKGTLVASALATAALSVIGTNYANDHPSAERDEHVLDIGMQPVTDSVDLPGLRLNIHDSDSEILENLTEVITPGTQDAGTDKNGGDTEGSTPTVAPGGSTPSRPSGTGEEVVRTAADIVRERMKTTHTEALPDIKMEWARLFSQDPQAEKMVDDSSIPAAAEAIKAMESSGDRVIEVVCTGYASDEDDTSDSVAGATNPGFGIPSQKNVDLATLRGAVVTEALATALEGKLSHPVPVINTKGVEIENPTTAQDIFSIAEQKGVSAVDLVKRYNRGKYENFTPEELAVFENLRDDRFVRCEVTIEHTGYALMLVPGTETIVPTEGQGDPGSDKPGGGGVTEIPPTAEDTPGGDTITSPDNTTVKQKETESTHRTKRYVLIPVLLPIFWRRRGEKGEDEAGDKPVVLTGPLDLPPLELDPIDIPTPPLVPLIPPIGRDKEEEEPGQDIPLPPRTRPPIVPPGGVVIPPSTVPPLTPPGGGYGGGGGQGGGGGGGGIEVGPPGGPPTGTPINPLVHPRPTRLSMDSVNPNMRTMAGQATRRRKQPRPYNYGKYPAALGGRNGRSKGGDRRGGTQ